MRNNKQKQSISAMCKFLRIFRKMFYNYREKMNIIDPYETKIIEIFNMKRRTYGTKRIKKALAKEKIIVSRRRIGRVMKAANLVSVYIKKNIAIIQL